MKTFTLLLFATLMVQNIAAQDILVKRSKKVFFEDGTPIQDGQRFPAQGRVKILKKGELLIEYRGYSKEFSRPGDYDLDSAIQVIRAYPLFQRHDSIYTVLESKNILACEFNYQVRATPGAVWDGLELLDQIKVDKSMLVTSRDTITLAWTNPAPYSGKYYILFMDLFEEYLTLLSTDENRIHVDLSRMMANRNILFKIIAEDCRESQMNAIRVDYKE